MTDSIRIKSLEADAMYAGIVIDTNNFTNQAGVRTFEAAAFLRRNGADVTRVRKLFRDKMEDYKARAEACLLYTSTLALVRDYPDGYEEMIQEETVGRGEQKADLVSLLKDRRFILV